MNNEYPRIVIPPEVKRKMIEIAREFRKKATLGEKMMWNALHGKETELDEKNLSMALAQIRESIQVVIRNKNQSIPSPLMGDGKGGGI